MSSKVKICESSLFLIIIVFHFLFIQLDCKKGSEDVASNPQLDSILEELAPVCFGQGILKASSYTGSYPHKIVILSSSGDKNGWSYSLPQVWWPSTVEETQLVAVLGNQNKETLSTCSYTTAPGGFGNTTAVLNRVGWIMKVELREARTGLLIDLTYLSTPLPDCPQTWTFSGSSDEEFYNQKIKVEALQKWLQPYVTWFTSNP
jgi:hypothetical protein